MCIAKALPPSVSPQESEGTSSLIVLPQWRSGFFYACVQGYARSSQSSKIYVAAYNANIFKYSDFYAFKEYKYTNKLLK